MRVRNCGIVKIPRNCRLILSKIYKKCLMDFGYVYPQDIDQEKDQCPQMQPTILFIYIYIYFFFLSNKYFLN